MFDKGYDEPSYYPGGSGPVEQPGKGAGDYAGDAAYYAGAAAGAAKTQVKKYLPIAIIAVIALVIIGFALSWLGSHQTITFNASEVDGGILTSARLTIKSGGNALQGLNSKSLTGPFQVNLQPGDYTYTVSAPDHKSATGTFKVPSDANGGNILATLAKDIDAKFDDPYMDSTTIYLNQVVSGTITITNTGETDIISEEIILVPMSKAPLDVNFTPSVISVSAGSATSISFSASLNTSPAAETKATRTIKIKGTNISKQISLTSMPSVKLADVDPSISNLKKETLKAGVAIYQDFTLKNSSKSIPMNDVLLEIVPESGSEASLGWMRFDLADADNSAARTIESISPNQSEPLRIYIEPPMNAAVNDGFVGNLRISSLSIEGVKTFPIVLKVTVPNTAKLTLVTSDLSIPCDEDEGTCVKTSSEGKAKLKNEGTVAIEDIDVEIDETKSEADCLAWLTSMTTTNISKIEPKAEANIIMDFTPLTDGPTYTRCFFRISYTDPINDEQISYTTENYLEIKRT